MNETCNNCENLRKENEALKLRIKYLEDRLEDLRYEGMGEDI